MSVERGDSPSTDLLTSSVRRRIVDLLANLPQLTDPETGRLHTTGMSAADLSNEVGLHVTTVRFHLDQLVAGGLLTSWFERRESAGRPRKLYGIESGTLESVNAPHHHELLSGLLLGSLTADPDGTRPTPEEVGARWARDRMVEAMEQGGIGADGHPATTAGQWLGRIGHMVDLLAEWGYTPDVSTSNRGRTASVDLHDCPFLDLAHANPAVVCGIHRGLIRGALSALGEGDAMIRLTPFVGPRHCVAAVTTTAPFDSPTARKPLSDKETQP